MPRNGISFQVTFEISRFSSTMLILRNDNVSSGLTRVAIFQIRSLRFGSLFFRMSLPQNHQPLLRDML